METQELNTGFLMAFKCQFGTSKPSNQDTQFETHSLGGAILTIYPLFVHYYSKALEKEGSFLNFLKLETKPINIL